MADATGRYQRYAEQLEHLDLISRARALGLDDADGGTVIPLFGRRHRLGPEGVTADSGKPAAEAIGALLMSYLLNNTRILPATSEMMSFREITGAGPLVSRFATNTNNLIRESFGADIGLLEHAALSLSGAHAQSGMAADLWLQFDALPHVPLFLSYNAPDDMLPAQCQILFTRTAESYLTLEDLFTIGTYLAGELLQYARRHGAGS
jgi:hypothetical protein